MEPIHTTAICKIPLDGIPPFCIVVGDPERAKLIVSKLKDGKMISEHFQYQTHVGSMNNGTKIAVASHGLGAAGAAICFKELIEAGVKTIIRAGIARSLDARFDVGDRLIVTGAHRADGATDGIVPLGYPAVADHEVVKALVDSSKKLDARHGTVGVGLVATVGHFHEGPLGNQNQMWARANILAVEMEISILFVLASLHEIRAGAIVTLDSNVFKKEDPKESEPNHQKMLNGTTSMIDLVLAAAVTLSTSI